MKFKNTNKIVQNKPWTHSIKQWLRSNSEYKTTVKHFIKFDIKHIKSGHLNNATVE